MRRIKSVIRFPFPVFMAREDKWFVIECPVLDIATQGKSEREAKENMKDLIKEYLRDPDTPKQFLKDIEFVSFNYLSVPVSKELLYGKT